MFGKLNIKTKLMGAFTIVLTLFTIAIWVAIGGVMSTGDKFETFLQDSLVKQTAYQNMFADGLLSGVALRNLVMKPQLKKPYEVVPDAIARFDKAYQTALKLASKDRETVDTLQTIDQEWQQARAAKLQVLELMKSGDREKATEVLTQTEHPHWQKVRIAVQNLVNTEQGKTRELRQAMLQEKESTVQTTLVLAAIAIITGIVITILMVNGIRQAFQRIINSLNDIASGHGDLTQRLDDSGSDEVAALSGAFNRFVEKIQSLVRQVAETASSLIRDAQSMSELSVDTKLNVNQQETKIEQVATAMNQMTATVQEVARNAAEASEAAQAADQEASDGHRVVTEVVSAINDLAQEVQNTSKTIHTVESNAKQIGTVLDVIRGIAEQTNLLALNAAIEAARAGEQGRGFAVVADEVRTLASRTQKSTQEIQAMIQRLQEGAKAAVSAMDSGQQKTHSTVEKAGLAGNALTAITHAVSKIADMNSQIATAAEEQSATAEDINRNVTSINTLAIQAAEGAEHTASSCQDLERQASTLHKMIGMFKI